MKFTEKEKETIKRLMRLGDSEKLAKETVIWNRPSEAKKMEQLKDLELFLK